jgi:hypothetical protein
MICFYRTLFLYCFVELAFGQIAANDILTADERILRQIYGCDDRTRDNVRPAPSRNRE